MSSLCSTLLAPCHGKLAAACAVVSRHLPETHLPHSHQVLGFRQRSLAYLLQRYCGIKADKSLGQRADWRQRCAGAWGCSQGMGLCCACLQCWCPVRCIHAPHHLLSHPSI